MSRYMLDTNIASFLLHGNTGVLSAVAKHSFGACCVSAITEGELRYGVAKNAGRRNLPQLIEDLLTRFEIMPWTSATARTYGALRWKLQARGQPPAPIDTLIAAHALTLDMTLVTNDDAFARVPNLKIEDWTG
jgi:tRNA(fMet)-specific endonuclease VapC